MLGRLGVLLGLTATLGSASGEDKALLERWQAAVAKAGDKEKNDGKKLFCKLFNSDT